MTPRLPWPRVRRCCFCNRQLRNCALFVTRCSEHSGTYRTCLLFPALRWFVCLVRRGAGRRAEPQPSRQSTTAAACSRFAAERRAGRRYRSTLAGDMIEVFKMVHKYYNVCAAVKLNFNTLSTTRGNKYKLQKSASHYNLRKFSFCSRVVNIIWNSLPDSVVCADTLNTFKSRLDKHWLD